jgi:hypothetical protein
LDASFVGAVLDAVDVTGSTLERVQLRPADVRKLIDLNAD